MAGLLLVMVGSEFWLSTEAFDKRGGFWLSTVAFGADPEGRRIACASVVGRPKSSEIDSCALSQTIFLRREGAQMRLHESRTREKQGGLSEDAKP